MKIFILPFIILQVALTHAQEIYKKATTLMGCGFEITVVADDKEQADEYTALAINEIKRIESKISSWNPNSQTSAINKGAGNGKPVKVDAEVFGLIERAMNISKLTQGAFDISFASMDKVWKFDGSMKEIPSQKIINKSIAKVGYQKIQLNKEHLTIYLPMKGMKIGFGAIGKGYAADKAKELLKGRGVQAGIINASGDLCTWGTQPDGKDWKVAIVNPLNKEKVFSWMPVNNSAVVTSGNYEKYVKFNGDLYTHIIDPRTGYPSKGILSVSIFCVSAELSDALATSVFVMGVDTGLDFINQLKGVECIVVDKDNQVQTSENIKLNKEKI